MVPSMRLLRLTHPFFRLFVLLGLIGPGGARAQEAVPVVTAEARRERVVEALPITGTITARQSAGLSPRTSGLVAEVHVDAGDLVEAGDALLSLDDTLARLAVQRTEAALAEARVRQEEAVRLRDEGRELVGKKAIPTTAAQAREAELAVAEAAANRLAVEARESAELLARHVIVAPFDGVVTRRLTDAGEWISTGMPALQLVAIDRARVDVQVPQERFAEIAADTPVEVFSGARPEESVPARVVARVPVSDPATRTALVRVEPIDPEVRLLPGKSARVVFRLRSAEPVLTVSRDALVRRPDGTVNVWLAQTEGDGWIAVPRRVDLGRLFSDLVEIRSGVEPGEAVIIRGNETLRDGQAVRPGSATVSLAR